MLKRFNVKNFLSFSEREDGYSEEFSMIPGNARYKKEHLYTNGTEKVLKFAAIYGANAAGKSNVVKALDFMRKVICMGIPKRITEKYCKTDIANKEKPSYFEVELILDNHNYSYGFEIILSQGKIVSEWLVEFKSDNSEKELFVRDVEHGTCNILGWNQNKVLSERLDIFGQQIAEDTSILFLSEMNRNKNKFYVEFPDAQILNKIYKWFEKSLDINLPDEPISNYFYLGKGDNVDEICRMIAAFGTGITNYAVVNVGKEKLLDGMSPENRNDLEELIERFLMKINAFPDDNRGIRMFLRSRKEFFIVSLEKDQKPKFETIRFYHGNKEFTFGLDEESDGTIRLLDLLEVLLSDEEKTYVIDELDRCLHPCLTYKFIETFLNVMRKKNIQLIVTTHESRLLDFDLLRRDEIWFVDKRKTGESDIYSLEEYNTRLDFKIDKAYLEGRYGGVPIFSTLFPVKETYE
ncbi:MAG: ATP/GTP-binding protein [Firmicutes bacterium]|nr:ATP/GTP-binding protein [Bacillota bacterium]